MTLIDKCQKKEYVFQSSEEKIFQGKRVKGKNPRSLDLQNWPIYSKYALGNGMKVVAFDPFLPK